LSPLFLSFYPSLFPPPSLSLPYLHFSRPVQHDKYPRLSGHP
jgi:hypothetical protein